MRVLIFACMIAATSNAAFAQKQKTQQPPEPVMLTLSTGSTLATWDYAAPVPAHKTPVVFLHGGPGMFTTAKQFDNGQVFRDAGFNTLYFDQAGGGRSPRIEAKYYTIDRAVADLESFRISKGADKLVLWGSSYGADLAVLYGAKHPDHVAAFVLTSPGVFPGITVSHDYNKTARGKVELSKELKDAANLIDKNGAAAETRFSQDVAGKLMDELIQSDWSGAGQCKGSTAPVGITQNGGNLYANRMIQREMKKMPFPVFTAGAVPTLIIRGQCDYVPEKSLTMFRKLLGGEYVPVAGAGHSLIENRAVVDDAMRTFAVGPMANIP
jgi:pimeloyl-ACP methyl ester carboxylesterase